VKKGKFVLTSDLINISSETPKIVENTSNNKKEKSSELIEKEQLNVRISKELKMKLQIWCITNDKPMSEVLEQLIREKIS
jgi:hypothetical protein